MKKGGGEQGAKRPASARTAKTPKAPKVPKAAPPTREGVAARLLALFPPGELPALWKEAELKRRLSTAERPVLAAALTHLQEARQVLALRQGKGVFYLFAEQMRAWLADGTVVADSAKAVAASVAAAEDLWTVYGRLVRQSGGFPDVKIAGLRAELDAASAGELGGRLVELWREGRATLSHGDWSLADAATREAAVELNGERYLLVRFE